MFNPSSTVYGFETIELKPDGATLDVTLDNVEEYVELVTDLCLNTGIRRQMQAFRREYILSLVEMFSPTMLAKKSVV